MRQRRTRRRSTALLRDVVRVRAAAAAWAVVALTACAAGTSAVEACIEHSVEEGVDRAAAEAACQDAVET